MGGTTILPCSSQPQPHCLILRRSKSKWGRRCAVFKLLKELYNLLLIHFKRAPKQLWYELTNLPPDFQYLIKDQNLRSSFRFLLHSQSIQPQISNGQNGVRVCDWVMGLGFFGIIKVQLHWVSEFDSWMAYVWRLWRVFIIFSTVCTCCQGFNNTVTKYSIGPICILLC